MKCHVERNWLTRGYKVWLYSRGAGGNYLYTPLADQKFTKLSEGEAASEPSLELPEEALQALVAEASGVLPASDATTAHLKDAIGVRDRLLTLVEARS